MDQMRGMRGVLPELGDDGADAGVRFVDQIAVRTAVAVQPVAGRERDGIIGSAGLLPLIADVEAGRTAVESSGQATQLVGSIRPGKAWYAAAPQPGEHREGSGPVEAVDR